jgi:hypothetical protein
VILSTILQPYGLFLRGVTELDKTEIETYGFSPKKPALALVGNIGSSCWPVFSRSAEMQDGQPHPLDRWSRRVAEAIAAELPVQPVYPFEGPPYYPFQRWAQRAEALEQSPIGIMMHPEFGLWHSYRFALLGKHFEMTPASPPADSPCITCEATPCLHRCPVDAFDVNGYDVDRCRNYLRQTPQADCHEIGCLARYACPVAPDLRYAPEQGKFHLRAFLNPDI